MCKEYYNSTIGMFEIVANDQFLLGAKLLHDIDFEYKRANIKNHIINDTISQLDEYFAGNRTVFNLPVKLTGTPFQVKVWNALLGIPYGETRSYKDIAVSINSPNASRGVGQANKCNKFTIIVPCHRVINSNKNLGGYFGSGENGLKIKKFLLDLES